MFLHAKEAYKILDELSIISFFPKPQVSQPYNSIGFGIKRRYAKPAKCF
jgi:hypothetical protein